MILRYITIVCSWNCVNRNYVLNMEATNVIVELHFCMVKILKYIMCKFKHKNTLKMHFLAYQKRFKKFIFVRNNHICKEIFFISWKIQFENVKTNMLPMFTKVFLISMCLPATRKFRISFFCNFLIFLIFFLYISDSNISYPNSLFLNFVFLPKKLLKKNCIKGFCWNLFFI